MKAKYELDEIVLVPMRVVAMSAIDGNILYELTPNVASGYVPSKKKGFGDIVGNTHIGEESDEEVYDYRVPNLELFEHQIAQSNK